MVRLYRTVQRRRVVFFFYISGLGKLWEYLLDEARENLPEHFWHGLLTEPTRTTPNRHEPQRCLGKQDERAVSSAFRVVRSGSHRFGEKSVPEVLWEVLLGFVQENLK